MMGDSEARYSLSNGTHELRSSGGTCRLVVRFRKTPYPSGRAGTQAMRISRLGEARVVRFGSLLAARRSLRDEGFAKRVPLPPAELLLHYP